MSVSKNKQKHKKETLFDNIERIRDLVSRKRLKKRKVKSLLKKIYKQTVRLEDRYLSFFDDKLRKKLKKILPNNIHIKKHKKDNEFSNTIELLVDGEEVFSRIIKNINETKKSILIQMFIWKNDQIGNKIGKALLKAAKRGVKIEIRKDALGSVFEAGGYGGRGFFESNSGFKLKSISKLIAMVYKEPNKQKIKNFKISDKLCTHKNVTVMKDENLNDHSKYYIFDDKIFMTGGMNIGDEYHSNTNPKKARHDFMVNMESRALVQKFKKRLQGNDVDDFDYGSSFEFSINVLNGKKKQFEIVKKLLELLDKAQKKVVLEVAYMGEQSINDKLIEIAKKGVKVELIIPKKSNLQDDLNKMIAAKLLEATGGKIEVLLYPKAMHSKAILIDDKVSFLGSANLNFGALHELKETNVLVNDADCKFTKKFKKTLKADAKISQKVTSKKRLKFQSLKAWLEYAIGRI
ncbi:phosphatidylserine/phosphatidylglycerophosphate/cardiolipin synthase family protein [Candidatus Peregrinibacteria bacterium]|jgi:cardiolipin synthase A/B|nr:phosphatidylserine/phosphatidylglycerophosphate/cardiolipin synthase family protein [Candidatus Peregrinibacteria bacterium]MBT4147968.1 phosphatidylserine/phosphatidylglycerophosphate/cardiolipin synthase family protein [Candidatus Peregrinibacteria bacterium]MBT4366125.1 phosphatidylserine/phosphatidylglycerophosphate/cardiolipin synthase family protein [Candidatus Peregrinibacteria bacterium]MBT4456217.1 phosphatidylserine/phosphatidylglycerophosphate/cardiolipin synthase family protein [C